uniref:hypothetical protein n=1 Tax=Clostridium sp. NkU-1 TaxID=1095009 RepID=UPI0006CF566A
MEFVITTSRYKARLEGKIVYVKEQDKGWRYSAAIRAVDEENKRQYMQIIYDRTHSLPMQMDLWVTAYDDMLRNIKKRLKQPFKDKRKMPRIPMERQITFTNGAACRLVDFNYCYFSVSDFNTNGSQDDTFIYNTESGIPLVLKRTGIYIRHSSEELLSVVNLDDLTGKNIINQILVDIKNTDEKEG